MNWAYYANNLSGNLPYFMDGNYYANNPTFLLGFIEELFTSSDVQLVCYETEKSESIVASSLGLKLSRLPL